LLTQSHGKPFAADLDFTRQSPVEFLHDHHPPLESVLISVSLYVT
jgi:hypothetical protein